MSFRELTGELFGEGLAQPQNVVVLSRVDSTNAIGRRIVQESLEECDCVPPALVVAYEQTGGRGRQGRAWSSPRGRGVYASLLLPIAEREVLPTVPLLVAVGLCRAVNRHLDGACRLKWPNDLLVGGRKLAGVLVETIFHAEAAVAAVIGFGVNHSQRREELPIEQATSLALEMDEPPPLGELVRQLVAAVEAELARLGDAAYAIDAYESLSLHAPGERLHLRVDGSEVEGTFRGFDRRGFLRLETGGREVLLSVGEVVEG